MKHYNVDSFLLIGISFKTAPVDYREKFSFSGDTLSESLAKIKNIPGISECVVISTCNRTELYILRDGSQNSVRENINSFILDQSGMDESFLKHFYYKNGSDAIEHLFNVSCGLDSMILGEPQIFGQVKNAFATACDHSATGPYLNRLFHQAFTAGKEIRKSTSITKGIISISSAAVMLGKKIFGSFNHRNALLVGAGKIGKLCAKQLIDSGVENLYITNRTPERAMELAEELNGQIIPFTEMNDMLDKVDIIISSVGAPKPVITKEDLETARKHCPEKKMTIIDLGVPRNVAPGVSDIENIHLFNIDDLENVTFETHKKRSMEVTKVQKIITTNIDEYCSWLCEREVAPVIDILHKKCESLRQGELDRISNKISNETFDIIDLISRRIVRKILHNPTVTVRKSESGKGREYLLESIHELFINEQCG